MERVLNYIKNIFIADELKSEYLKNNLSVVLYALLIGSGLITIVAVAGPWLSAEAKYITFSSCILFLILLWLNKRGYQSAIAFIVTMAILLIANVGMYIGRGFRDVSMLVFPGVVILASLILNRSLFIFFTVLTLSNLILVGLAESNDYFQHEVSGFTNIGEVFTAASILAMTAAVVFIIHNSLLNVFQRAQKSEYQFRSFFNSSPDGIVIMDFSGIVQQVNRTISKMFDYQSADVIGRHFSEFIPESDSEAISSIIQSLISGISPEEPFETEIILQNGDKIPIHLRGWLVRDSESRPLALGAFIKDITVQRDLIAAKSSLEDQLKHIQKIEAIGTLAGGIAHDFNNILVGILGYAELAMTRLTDDPLIKDYLEKIGDAGMRAKELVRQILKFSRREKGEFGPVSLGSLIKEVARLAESTFPAKVVIKKTITADPDLINADATQIHQVLMNLFTNALHALKDNEGIISVHLGNYLLKESKSYLSMQLPPGQYLHIQIVDNGCGMTPEVLNRAFEPYFTTKKIDQGTGLGLSVTMGIIQNHNGLIEVSSTPKVGTTFNIYFPELREKKIADKKIPVIRHKGNGEQVLVVDDEDFFVSIMRAYLVNMNYKPTVFHDSLEALAYLKENHHQYSLLITDLSMPKMSGIELISELKKFNINIPVILCTGFSDDVTEETASYYGISRFLLKPVSKSDIETAIYHVFNETIIDKKS